MKLRDEVVAAIDELIDVNENMTLSIDERNRDLVERVHRMPVYVQVESSRWCARHWSVILNLDDHRCSAFGMDGRDLEDVGRCQPVPLYVEAPDP